MAAVKNVERVYENLKHLIDGLKTQKGDVSERIGIFLVEE
jgi:hypothetical protein